jgi:hypothetical protein
MKTIFKYPLSVTDTQVLKMPKNADVFSAQFQSDQLCVWGLVDTEAELEDREFRIFGTGHPFEVSGMFRFVDTVQQGSLVWHIFVKLPI